MTKMIEWVKNFREGAIKPKIDKDRGTFPYLSNSGFVNITSNGVITSVLLVPSGYRFMLEGFVVNNSQVANLFVLYDAGSAVTQLVYQVAQSKTDVVTGLKIPFQSGVYISGGPTALTIRIFGYLIESDIV